MTFSRNNTHPFLIKRLELKGVAAVHRVRRVAGGQLLANPYTPQAIGGVDFTLSVRADSAIQNAAAFRVLQGPAS